MIWYCIAAWAVRNFEWLRERALRTPYSHITSPDGQSVYMYRYWLFNPYSLDTGKKEGLGSEASRTLWSLLPSIRLHHIMRPDSDRHMHDHPWNARTIVLRGWYEEERYEQWMDAARREKIHQDHKEHVAEYVIDQWVNSETRRPGYTGRLLFGQFHRISHVSQGGVWTMFFTWKYRGTWGFDVKGIKVPWRTYLAERDAE